MLELLVVLAVIMLLISILLPALRAARESARTVSCLSNQHQLIIAWTLYSDDYKGYAMPLAYWTAEDTQGGQQIFWWGTYSVQSGAVDHSRGFISPYLGATLAQRSVFECVSQPWGSYVAQGPVPQPTSTYGYNGYYLSPAKTPGWGAQIGFRPWRRVFEVPRPSDIFVFADTLLALGPVRNCALLDPPQLFSSSKKGWIPNDSPTTAFRHHTRGKGRGTAVAARADGSAHQVNSEPDWIVNEDLYIGSAGTTNEEHYVPDAAEWR